MRARASMTCTPYYQNQEPLLVGLTRHAHSWDGGTGAVPGGSQGLSGTRVFLTAPLAVPRGLTYLFYRGAPGLARGLFLQPCLEGLAGLTPACSSPPERGPALLAETDWTCPFGSRSGSRLPLAALELSAPWPSFLFLQLGPVAAGQARVFMLQPAPCKRMATPACICSC